MTDLRQKLIALRDEAGYSEFWREVKSLSRERLQNNDREKRKPIPWGIIKRHYEKQKGVCSWCGKDMKLIRNEIEGDHKNPNEQDFNKDSNIQVLHKSCNRQKSSMSIAEQSKHKGTTYREILENEI